MGTKIPAENRRIAISVTGPDMYTALCDSDKIACYAALFSEFGIKIIEELRLDLIKDLSHKNLDDLLSHNDLEKIATNRSSAELYQVGGGFNGSEEERLGYLVHAAMKHIAFIDIEARHYNQFKLPSGSETRLIVSKHDFKESPLNLRSYFHDTFDGKPGIPKIAVTAQKEFDNELMYDLIMEESKRGSIIGINMGKIGRDSRVYGPLHGSLLTFAAIDGECGSGPAQFPVEDLVSRWQKEDLI